MEIKQVVIHELIKKAASTEISSKKADKLLDVESEMVIKLVNELNKLYGSKGNNAIYGTFSGENVTNEFSSYTNAYLTDETDQHFLALSIRCMDELEREARMPSSTGGYLVFARYKEQDNFLLIAMIKDKKGLQVNENLEPESITEIDLSKIHQAARINLRLYEAFSDEKDLEDDEEKAYLSFISPKTNSEVSGYFRQSLDCIDGVPASRATNNAFKVVSDYCQSIPELRLLRAKAKDSLIVYLETCLDNGKPATLAGIEHSIGQIVPAEQSELIAGFCEFANSDKYQLPDAFGVNSGKLKEHTRIKGKGNSWELTFMRKAVGTDDNSELRYNKDAGTLMIRCTDELKEQIESELNNNSHGNN